jgi:transposase
VAAAPERYELHHQDETHVETNPYRGAAALCQVWHRRGTQPTVPAVGTNRRVTVFGSVEVFGRGRVEVVQARQDSAGFIRYLEALDERRQATERAIYLVLDNGPCHTSTLSQAALAEREAWLHVIWLSRYSPQLNQKEPEWKRLKRDVRSHLATDLRTFVDEIVSGLDRLGGEMRTVIDAVPEWFIAGHRREPTGRAPGRPTGAKDTTPRRRRSANLPAST